MNSVVRVSLPMCFQMEFQNFVEEFISNLRIPMTYMEKHPHVENTLQFAAKFAISLQPQSENEEEYEEMHKFLERLFEFLLNSHGAKEVAVIHLKSFPFVTKFPKKKATYLIQRALLCMRCPIRCNVLQ